MTRIINMRWLLYQSLILYNNILRLIILFFWLILHDHLLSDIISFLSSLVLRFLMSLLLVYLFKPSIKRHRIGSLLRSRLVEILWSSLSILVLLGSAIFYSCKISTRGLATFCLWNLSIPWSSHHKLRVLSLALVANMRGVMNGLVSKGWNLMLHLLKLLTLLSKP